MEDQMSIITFLSFILLCPMTYANNVMDTLPKVKGIIKKIDAVSSRVSIKHEEIPNLNMPPMTMSFWAQDSKILVGLSVGDNIYFTANEIDGEIVVISIEKIEDAEISIQKIICYGQANTYPKTNVEIEIRKNKFSTIRYEISEGSLKGTAYINSIGRMSLQKTGSHFSFISETGKLSSQLTFFTNGLKIQDARFSNYSANMADSPVNCFFQ